MAAPMETPSAQIDRENFERWTMNPGVYAFVPERATMRLREYMKDFDEETVVTVEGVPLLLPSSGRPLRACEALPERADLALNADGSLVSSAEFTERYKKWLTGHKMPEGTNVDYEPIPNPAYYVRQIPDAYSESNGLMEIAFDPLLDKEAAKPGEYDDQGRKRGEEGFEGDKTGDKLLDALVAQLSPEQAAAVIEQKLGIEVPVVGASEESEPFEAGDQEDPAPEPARGVDFAPCGKSVKPGYVSRHMLRCSQPECAERREGASEE